MNILKFELNHAKSYYKIGIDFCVGDNDGAGTIVWNTLISGIPLYEIKLHI